MTAVAASFQESVIHTSISAQLDLTKDLSGRKCNIQRHETFFFFAVTVSQLSQRLNVSHFHIYFSYLKKNNMTRETFSCLSQKSEEPDKTEHSYKKKKKVLYSAKAP